MFESFLFGGLTIGFDGGKVARPQILELEAMDEGKHRKVLMKETCRNSANKRGKRKEGVSKKASKTNEEKKGKVRCGDQTFFFEESSSFLHERENARDALFIQQLVLAGEIPKTVRLFGEEGVDGALKDGLGV